MADRVHPKYATRAEIEFLRSGAPRWEVLEAPDGALDLGRDDRGLRIGPTAVYAILEHDVFDAGGSAGLAHNLESWRPGQGWERMPNRPPGEATGLTVGSDGNVLWLELIQGARLSVRGGAFVPVDDALAGRKVTDGLVDPERAGVVYVGTDLGLFVSSDSGQSWVLAGGPGIRAHVAGLAYDPMARELIAATRDGLYYVDLGDS